MRRDPYRQYRRGMRRNWRARHGRYPVLVMDDLGYQPLILIAAAAISRFAYRHRSAFLPFVVAVASFALAAILHQHHPGLWVTTAVITAAAAFILGIPHRLLWVNPPRNLAAGALTRMWEACGIGRATERVYVTAVVVTAGGWVSAAIAVGPTVKPLPTIAEISATILGIPWWAHRRRRGRVRIERTIQAWPGLADDMGLPGSRIASATGDSWGFTARVILRKGSTAAQAISQIPAIESGLGMRPGSVRALPDPARADRIILRVIEDDPHAQPVSWPGQPETSITKPAVIGLFEDGRPVDAVILRRNVLIGGTTGSGKSGILNVILAYLAACHDATIWGVDLKGGMELQPWAQCLTRLATTPLEAVELFRDAIRELERRAAMMTAKGARVWEPTRGMPALIIIVDEYAELSAEAQDYADSLARRGRAVAVNLIAATQRPTQEAMGGNAVRSQMDVRICLRVRERRDADLILGQGSVTAGWHAHALSQPGAFLISAPEHSTPERARGYLITDDQVADHARRHARPALRAASEPGGPQTAPRVPQTPADAPSGADARPDPETALWAALRNAGSSGVEARALAKITGMGRTWIYERLREHAEAGRVVQVSHGHWRAASSGQADR
jgi:S-DNA-T family DNA segregation ATPase FtsK/SpoIIIE